MYERMLLLVATCFYLSGLVPLARWWRWRRQHSRSTLVILNYHRATGVHLRQHLLYLKRHYRLLHLEAALEELYSPYNRVCQNRDRRMPLVVTFDDGYCDNYMCAFTLACELQVPITIFLIPGYIESGNRFCWQEGEHLVSHARVSEATIQECTYHLDNADERVSLTQVINARVNHASSIVGREEFLANMHRMLAVPSAASVQEQAAFPLTWAQVQAMEQSGLVSFGAHTMHHPILADLSDPTEAEYEVNASRMELERYFQHPVRTFAYPFGRLEDIGGNGVRAVQKAGHDWAVTTLPGYNTAQTAPHLLRRFPVDGNEPWMIVAAKATGIWSFFSHPLWMMGALAHRLSKI